VVDTDTYKEIDGQLGVVYALLSSERIRTEPHSTRVVTVSQWVSEAAIGKRIVRAKQCIRASGHGSSCPLPHSGGRGRRRNPRRANR
jgi:hypothetical protein